MTAPRLIRLVPTGVCHEDIELVDPEEVMPLSEEQFKRMPELFVVPPHHVKMVVRAIEQAHGIGRRLDA
jgi:hypothetical protein